MFYEDQGNTDFKFRYKKQREYVKADFESKNSFLRLLFLFFGSLEREGEEKKDRGEPRGEELVLLGRTNNSMS